MLAFAAANARTDSHVTGSGTLWCKRFFKTTKNATADPGSDIVILIHFKGTPAQLEQLEAGLKDGAFVWK